VPRGQEDLLASARGGDQEAFRRLVEGHRAALHSHCYRMLGSFHDAEDALQETMVRSWRGLARYEGRSALSTWLHRIATNVCLDALSRRELRIVPLDGVPNAAPSEERPQEPVSMESPPDEARLVPAAATPEDHYAQREALELALAALIEHLPARQRAVLLLREVLGFTAKEVASLLGCTVASTNSLLQRARGRIGERLPEPGRRACALGDATVRAEVEGLLDAFERGDVDGILRLLAGEEARSPHAGRPARRRSWRPASPRLGELACSASR